MDTKTNFQFLKGLLILTSFLTFACQNEETPAPVVEPPISSGNSAIELIEDQINGANIMIVGSPVDGFIVSFELKDGFEQLTFETIQGELPTILRDSEGNEWDWFGQAVKGPRTGAQLPIPNAYMGYWLTFGAMYPGIELYSGQEARGNLPQPQANHPDWLIPTDFLFQGSGFDAITPLDKPIFEKYDFKNDQENGFYLKDQDLVVGVQVGQEVRGYSHAVADWHEVVNDEIGNQALAIIYCPLTGTACAWDRIHNNEELVFGVSGLLYNTNVIPFDRQTNSHWTQIENRAVRGDLKGTRLKKLPVIEMPWRTWKAVYKTPTVLSGNQGTGLDYKEYPYGDYRTNHDYLAYPITYDDDRLPRKERVYAVIVDGKAKAYQWRDFE